MFGLRWALQQSAGGLSRSRVDLARLTLAQIKTLAQDRNWLLVVIGWQLSPFTEYNDPIVNIPLAWLLAALLQGVFGWERKHTLVPCYWFTNFLGILLLVIGLKRSKRALTVTKAEIAKLISVTLIFSLVLYLLGKVF
jgi:hypothetical protein